MVVPSATNNFSISRERAGERRRRIPDLTLALSREDRERPVSKMTVGQNYAALTKQARPEQHLAVVPITARVRVFRISFPLYYVIARNGSNYLAGTSWTKRNLRGRIPRLEIIFKIITRSKLDSVAREEFLIARRSFYKSPRGQCTLQSIGNRIEPEEFELC